MAPPSGKWWRKLRSACTPSTLDPSVAKLDEEASCADLPLWFLQENSGWWCLDLQHYFCRHSQVCHQKTEGLERPVGAPRFETLLAYNKWVNLCNKNINKKYHINIQSL